MGRKRTPGLYLQNGIWHIDKWYKGKRICQSCNTTKLVVAEQYLTFLLEEYRQAEIYGVRPKRTFERAAKKFVKENQHKRSIKDDISRLKGLMPYIGHYELDKLHRGILLPWIEVRQKDGISTGTINHGLKVVRRILNLAAGEWIDEYGLTWLLSAPKISLLPDTDKKQPYPLDWKEQDRLFRILPIHLKHMSLFAVNTGCRDSEICNLRWNWEVNVAEIMATVFIIPAGYVKNGQNRLVVLNRIASEVVKSQRGKHVSHVFTYNGKPLTRMLNSGWCTARRRVGLTQVRVHDLKHTYGRRLRAAGVSFEDRQELLGHKSSRVTTQYSTAGLQRLLDSANTVCERNINSIGIEFLLRSDSLPRKNPVYKECKNIVPL